MPNGARSTQFAALVVSLLALGACASNKGRINQFDRFAEAGVAYTESVEGLLEASLATVIDTDNRSLIFFRTLNRDEDRRLVELERLDNATRERAAILGDIRTQLDILQDYFIVLGMLAGRDEGGAVAEATSGISESSQRLVERLGGVSETIRNASIGGRSIGELVEKAIPFTVAAYQRAALDRTLKATAEPVSQAISIHQAALEAIRDQMEADLDFAFQQDRTTTVAIPFAGDGVLPSDWGDLRANSLMRQMQIVELDEAVNASQKLQLAFLALVEKRADNLSFENLISDLYERVALAGA